MIKALDENNNYIDIYRAVKGRQYYCPFCGQPMSQRHGEIREHCFAHYPEKSSHVTGYRKCTETWHYDTTEWHIDWQRKFPEECFEVIVEFDGKRHIADVLINDTVIEFQHSPISADEFRERNEFYSNCGYKVIWLFDLSEEYESGAITLSDSYNSYYGDQYFWSRVKRPFKELVVKNEPATIYVQFPGASDEFCIERVTYSSDNFRHFTTSNNAVFSPEEFISFALNNIKRLLPYKEAEITNPEKYEQMGGKTIFDLWDEKYEYAIVRNMATDKEILLSGSRGELRRRYTRDNPEGLIEGKYSYLNAEGKYVYSKYYILKNVDKPVWMLKMSHDRDFAKEAEEDRIRQEKIEAARRAEEERRLEMERLAEENRRREEDARKKAEEERQKREEEERILREKRRQEAIEQHKIKEAKEKIETASRKELYAANQLDESIIAESLSKRKCPICGTTLYVQGGRAFCGSLYACGYTVKPEHYKYVRGMKR